MLENKDIRILLAEDNSDIYGFVRDAVAEIGADLVITASFEEAIELILSGVFDIAILDGHLSRENGRNLDIHNQDAVELIALIRSNELKTKTIGLGAFPIKEADIDVKKHNYENLVPAMLKLLIEKYLEEMKEEIAETGEVPLHIQQLIDFLKESE